MWCHEMNTFKGKLKEERENPSHPISYYEICFNTVLNYPERTRPTVCNIDTPHPLKDFAGCLKNMAALF